MGESHHKVCPQCGQKDLISRKVVVGLTDGEPGKVRYQEVHSLKCPHCGWRGEEVSDPKAD